jgi:preprotein translocase SecA subunit
MGRIHRFLGMTVGVVVPQMEHADKQASYQADITYGTNNEFGFDYLRDNMATQVSERFQRGLNYAIVDEVDSILIDEARTPLIISGQAEDSTELYRRINLLVPKLSKQEKEDTPGDFFVDLKQHQVTLSEQGHEHAEELMSEAGLLAEGASLYDPSNIVLMHHLYAGIRAHALYHRDQHYVVMNDEIVIVDEFTGRMMQGRRWSDGLHQAVEAKEGVTIKNESQTLASITFQNYFRIYKKLSGMTGTADTEAFEFSSIYNLETVIIPTHRPMVRKDLNDQVFITAKEKYQAIINDVKERAAKGQPVLLGTTSVENSELISSMLTKEGMPHNVLNAKQHAREAEIVVQAGRPKQITIATNMAGRGTDIVLGGNPDPEIQKVKGDETLPEPSKESRIAEIRAEWNKLHEQVVAAGGLHIIGSERHESRRIDNQLRGRSGRQGDPGTSRFFLSFEDPLLKIFAGERLQSIMRSLKIPEGEAIEARMVTRSIENAQRKVEARNFDIRKNLLEFDDVANDQRKVIYAQRNELLESKDISETITSIRGAVLAMTAQEFIPPDSVEEQWDLPGPGEEARERVLVHGAGGRVGAGRHDARRRAARDEGDRGRGQGLRRQVSARQRRSRIAPSLRARGHVAGDRHALARAPRGARLSAPGHPSAWLRAEAAEAGIQARGIRALRRDAGLDQARGHEDPHEHPRAHARGSRGGRAAARGSRARRAQHPVPARRLQRGHGRRLRKPAKRCPCRGRSPRASRRIGAAFRALLAEGGAATTPALRIGQEVQALPREACVITVRRAIPEDFEAWTRHFEDESAHRGNAAAPYPSREEWRKRLAETPDGPLPLLSPARVTKSSAMRACIRSAARRAAPRDGPRHGGPFTLAGEGRRHRR